MKLNFLKVLSKPSFPVKPLSCFQYYFTKFVLFLFIICTTILSIKIIVLFSIEIGKGKLTVGKIYGGLLILENWKTTKFGRIPNSQRPVKTFYTYNH